MTARPDNIHNPIILVNYQGGARDIATHRWSKFMVDVFWLLGFACESLRASCTVRSWIQVLKRSSWFVSLLCWLVQYMCYLLFIGSFPYTPLLWLTPRDTYHCSSHLLDLWTWGFSKHPPMGAGLLFSPSCVRDAFHSTAQTLSYSYWFWPGPMSLFVLLLKLQSVQISLSRFCRGYLPCTNLLLLIHPLNGPLLAAI